MFSMNNPLTLEYLVHPFLVNLGMNKTSITQKPDVYLADG